MKKINKILRKAKRILNGKNHIKTDMDYFDEGFISKYQDMNGRAFYFKKATTNEESEKIRDKVLKEFGHLLYFFKVELSTGDSRKIATNNFARTKIHKAIKKIVNDSNNVPEESISITSLAPSMDWDTDID